MKKAAFYTLGCRVNQYETQVMMNIFKEKGFEISTFDDKCDVYIVNSCAVTAMSEKKSRQVLRKAKRLNPESVCAIVGCYPQKEQRSFDLTEADIIMGNDKKDEIFEAIENVLKSKVTFFGFDDAMSFRKYREETCSPLFDNKTRAMIKIQDGCDRFCSYCIIPYVRGPVRSRKIENILKEAEELASKGFVEVVLTGIQTAAYGQDLEKGSLIEVIEKVALIDGIKRIRLGSLEPLIITEDFLDRAKNTGKVCHSFHLSLQSGCDSVLKRMNRRYTVKQYENSIKLIRKYYPDAAITTDVIAGFPGETEEEFKTSLEFIRSVGFSHIHAFPYSPREGTKAALIPEQLDKNVKEERVKLLNRISLESHKKFINSLHGNSYEVLIEKRTDENMYEGLTPNYITVSVRSDTDITDKITVVTLNDKNTQ